MLRHGLDASDVGPEGEAVADAIEARLRTGRPLAAEEWIARHEASLGRSSARQGVAASQRPRGAPNSIVSPNNFPHWR